MAFKHGVYTDEQETTLISLAETTAGLQVIIGTAPVNQADDPSAAVNTPILAYSYKEAVSAVGYSDDFESYTLCEAIKANFQVVGAAPIVLINVLDPSTHTTSIETTSVSVSDSVALVEEEGILLDGLTVTYDSTTLTADTDYTASFDDDGYLEIVVLDDGAAADATTLTISGTKLDPSAITADDIIGGVDSDGNETGMEVIRQVYPKLGLVPGILLAPRWSADAEVAAALQAKCTSINGVFTAVCYIDLDSSSDGATYYTGVNAQKTAQALTSEHAYAIWGYGKVGDTIYSGSTLAGALTAYTDAQNNDIPNVSPSNETISISAACLADGTELLLDLEQANVVNSYGVATWRNRSGSFVLWGNETTAYPSNTDPKDRFISARRFMSWTRNNFIVTYSPKVDKPANPRLIQAIVDAEGLRGNSYISSGICAKYELAYDSDNSDLVNGVIAFHLTTAIYLPAEDIEMTIEFDADALEAALES